ncbi:hypothetical protein MBM_01351 [Drepanopeziza brunnea f. sp. 'multigermtubi' MB_m1]|uniref:Uncharacterized protein n=1 Tax=Marssonina brunnea f. sp. multigermtubi (strain MB_m1) TaxID=1072389 RepID=K1Y676_MARBU|nr:uncharacterized protein MBM_01351 [Drepanopeziza brunnea f. sp. 'multigermtubi' MB_m1]EKD20669.1 hypothetical protein MBM_01351 [Drepanopeziza brunnea f. sp. 'multigermtubi' MB_m1]
MFEHIRNIKADIQGSLRARRQPARAQSALPTLRDDNYDEMLANAEAQEAQDKLDATMGVFARFRRTTSLKEITIPPISRTKPLTFTNLFGALKKDPGISCLAVDENTSSECQGPVIRPSGEIIKRKPVTPPLSAFKVCDVPKFDVQAPRRNPDSVHLARSVLKHRYTTKFEMEGFEPAKGRLRSDYYFMWASDEELERKVMEDIIWVRERYAQAGREEPDDNAVIAWYMEDSDF